jgi:hypothetical protein
MDGRNVGRRGQHVPIFQMPGSFFLQKDGGQASCLFFSVFLLGSAVGRKVS